MGGYGDISTFLGDLPLEDVLGKVENLVSIGGVSGRTDNVAFRNILQSLMAYYGIKHTQDDRYGQVLQTLRVVTKDPNAELPLIIKDGITITPATD